MFHVADSTPARAVRIGGCLATIAVAVRSAFSDRPDGAPYLILFVAVFAFAFCAVTGRSVPVARRALATGGIVGLAAAGLPAIVFVLSPPVPASGGWAVVVLVVAATVAAGLNRFEGWDAVVAGLLAAVIVGLLLGPIVVAMAQLGPVSWVPDRWSGALTPAARLYERRYLAGDNYVVLLLLGDLLALLLGFSARRRRGRARPASARSFAADPRDRDGHQPRRIEPGEV